MREIRGTLYCNDGDWVESRTALVEHFDGRLELVQWDEQAAMQARVARAAPAELAQPQPELEIA